MKRKWGVDESNEAPEPQDNGTPIRKSGRARTAPVRDYEDVVVETPSRRGKSRQVIVEEAEDEGSSREELETPSKRRKDKRLISGEQNVHTTTPKQPKQASESFTTPTKAPNGTSAIAITRNADRSARRKSARLLISRAATGDGSDEEDFQDGLLAQRILDDDDDELGDGEDVEDGGRSGDEIPQDALEHDDGLLPETPSKRKRGRPKGWKKARTPSPPPDLPPYEHYFFHNRPGGSKVSDNTLSSSELITHEDYYTTTTAWKDPHEPGLDFLHALHSQSFDQWVFELAQGFNICVYGYGSKRELLLDFAGHLSSQDVDQKIIIVNGHNAALTPRDILTTLASTIPSLSTTKLGSQPPDMLNIILSALSKSPPNPPTALILHSIDAPPLRRPATQSLLATLSRTPHIHLLSSADTPNFPLLWDAPLRADFNFLFHDCTTYAPYDAEIAAGTLGGVVDEVNSLLGRSGRKMHGREGVMYVLKSLTASARGLFGLLVAELLSMDEGEGVVGLGAGDGDGDGDGDEFEEAVAGGVRKRVNAGGVDAAIEYRALYQKAVGQFIATNEISFRGLLKEFHDHEMVVSRRDAAGMEMLGVPFRREECEALVEDLMGET